MAIQYTNTLNDVKGILVLSDGELKKYQVILEIIKWGSLSKSPKPIEDATEEILEKLFGNLITNYLSSLGLQISQYGSERQDKNIFLRRGDGSYYFKESKAPYFHIYCEKSFMTPMFNFFVDPERSDSMEVALFVEGCNRHARYLIDSRLFCLRDAGLEQLAIRQSDHAGVFSIAPLTQMPRFLEIMKELLGYLKQEGLEKLEQARDTIYKVPDEFRETTKDHYARVVLNAFGIEI